MEIHNNIKSVEENIKNVILNINTLDDSNYMPIVDDIEMTSLIYPTPDEIEQQTILNNTVQQTNKKKILYIVTTYIIIIIFIILIYILISLVQI